MVAVIINHFDERILPSGYLGVDVFFVISGYVITSSLVGRARLGFGDFISGFYERRIKRLIPALVLFVLVTSIMICLVNPSPMLALWTGLTSLFGLSNLYLLRHSTDYFAQSTELNPFVHTWSLGVEEQFYFVFPFLLWLSGYSQEKENGTRNLLLSVGGLSIASLLGFAYLHKVDQSAAYFLMPVRFWELAAGCFVFVALRKNFLILNKIKFIPGFLVFLGMISVLFMPISKTVTATILIVLLTSILISNLREDSVVFRFLTAKKIVYVGAISYSLYLWHWGIISISHWTIGIYWWTVPFQAALMFLLAAASYRFVETPLRSKTWFNVRWKTFIGGGVAVFASVCMIFILALPLNGYLYTGAYKNTDFVHVQNNMECELGGNLASKTPGECLARKDIKPSIFVLGNSHASNLVPSLQKVSKKLGYSNVYYLTNVQMYDPDFWSGSKLLVDFTNSLKKNDLIIYSHSSPNLAGDSPSMQIKKEIDVLRRLSIASGSTLVLVDDLPDFKESEFFPSFSFYRDGYIMRKEEAISRRIFLTDILQSYVDGKGVNYIDPFEVVCNEDQCPSVMDGELMYADSSPHFTKEGANSLIPLFYKYLPSVN